MLIYKKGASQKDQCAHRLMESPWNPEWHGGILVGDYYAEYHEERLYSVRHIRKGILSLVYARSPYDAVEKVQTAEKKDVEEG